MSVKKTRVFEIDGEQYRFDSQAFKTYIDSITDRRTGNTKEKLFNKISPEIGESPDAIKNWMYGKNGPGDLDIIKHASSILNIDFMLLLKRVEGEFEMNHLSDRQKDAAKRIYDKITWFLEEFNNTDGFTTWVFEFQDAGYRGPESKTYDRIEALLREVGLVIEQEYFDLHDEAIYDEFNEYFSEDIYETFNGKIDDCYRFDAMHEDSSNHSTWEDYEKAKRRLNEIIERYI